MKKLGKKWGNLLLPLLLCAALVLAAGCGKRGPVNEQGTEASAPEGAESVQEAGEGQNAEFQEDLSDYSDGESEGESSPEDEYLAEEGQDSGGAGPGEEDSGNDSWNQDDENGDYIDQQNPEEGGYEEDGSGSDQEYGSGEDPSYQDSYEENYEDSGGQVVENGVYTTKEDVALYIHTYGKLPSNFMTKKKARSLGWSGGSLEEYAPGMCIGGDRFGNYEGTLPDGNYHECDINTLGKERRGAERLVFSDDGRIYYTGDHYETFTLLYEK